jgi:DnaJ-like protein
LIRDPVSADYYAVLQVHPDADFEVIEAAYRQLMKKHHPDMAGGDPRRVAQHEDRAKAINQAFSVLRDPERRRRYDMDRLIGGTVRPAEPRSRASSPPAPPPTPPVAPPVAGGAETAYVAPPTRSPLLTPLDWLGAAYYLLPGPYEWEGGRKRELLSVLLLPPSGVAAYALASGRLAPLLGHSLSATVVAWAILAVCVAAVMWGSLLRVTIAAAPTIALLSGLLAPLLQGSHIPAWLAWCLLSCVSLLFAARAFVFGVLPMLVLILLIS